MTVTETAPSPVTLAELALSGVEPVDYGPLLERAQDAIAFERERADAAEAEAARLRAALEERDRAGEPGELLNPGKVAKMCGVDRVTVARWAAAGKLTAVRTSGGHRRYRESEVRALLAECRNERAQGTGGGA